MRMYYECKIDHRHRIGIVTLTGQVDGACIRKAMASLFEHHEWRPGYTSLWDAREVRSIVIGPEDLEAISRTMASIRMQAGAGRGAWVVRGEMAESIGLLLAHRAQRRGHERRSFTDYDEALRWLLEAGEPATQSPSRRGLPAE